jgi:hypothetical protein
MKAQGDVARALAEKEGWEYVELSNNNDPATALSSASTTSRPVSPVARCWASWSRSSGTAIRTS